MDQVGHGGRLSREELERLIRNGNVDTVLTVFPDMYGRLVGKRITGHFFLSDVLDGGMHACDYLLACDMEMDPVPGYAFASWADGYGDVHAIPDLRTLRIAAWLERTALVICDLVDEETGEPIAVAPRTILRRQVELAGAQGFTAKAGSELEFFLLCDSFEEAHRKHYEGLEPFGMYVEDYHVLQATREEPIVGRIRRSMDASDVPVEFSKGEWGPGQHEINLRYADMLEMADRHVIYKHAAKEIAVAAGHALTFMAKLDESLAGNSMHLHSSLWDLSTGEPLFSGDGQPLPGTRTSPSDLFRWYLGGLIAHARECSLFFAPNVNSYKRYVAGTFAPTGIAWSYDNRTAGFRIIGHGPSLRVECRIPGADANPYLAMAVTLAAGLDGIHNETEPPEAFVGDVYQASALPKIPSTLDEALEAFRGSDFMRSNLGDGVVDHYAHYAEVERDKHRAAVTGWERRRFLERV
jgi:glutamine synthetase